MLKSTLEHVYPAATVVKSIFSCFHDKVVACWPDYILRSARKGRAFQALVGTDLEVRGGSLQHPVWAALVRSSNISASNWVAQLAWIHVTVLLNRLHLCKLLRPIYEYCINEGMSRKAIHKTMLESAALIGASVLQVYLLQRLFERRLVTSRV